MPKLLDDDFPLHEPLTFTWAWRVPCRGRRRVPRLLTLELRPEAQGFSVWSGYKDWKEQAERHAASRKVSKQAALREFAFDRWRKVRQFSRKLTWRTAAFVLRDLFEADYGIDYQVAMEFEEFDPHKMEMSSELSPWLEDLMRVCVQQAAPADGFLLSLSEADIRRLWSLHGPLDSDFICELAEEAGKRRLWGTSLSRLARSFPIPGYEEEAEMEDPNCEADGDAALERFLACLGREPLPVYAPEELCCYPPPRSPRLASRLLALWMRKTFGPPAPSFFFWKPNTGVFLPWVLDRDLEHTLGIVARKDPHRLARLMDHIARRLEQIVHAALENHAKEKARRGSPCPPGDSEAREAEFYGKLLKASENLLAERREPKLRPFWTLHARRESPLDGTPNPTTPVPEEMFLTADDAIAFAKRLVDDFLSRPWPARTSARALYDLFVLEIGQLSLGGVREIAFDPMAYLVNRIREITGADPWAAPEQERRTTAC